MSTQRCLTHHYPFALDAVAELLCDSEYLRMRSESAGEENVQIEVAKVDGATRVVTARYLKSQVPEFAKKLIGSRNRIVDDTTWRRLGDGFSATYTIVVEGAPVTVTGSTKLSAVGPEQTKYETRFEVSSRLPLIARKVEGVVADLVEETLRQHAVSNETRLSTAPPPAIASQDE